ncbi:hypothetical protein [Planktotalea sp.]|uniref:hypothetical protein n=1 Tax=Planktotalea sp. TaxID=2029877 RepID=UPI003D6C6DA6
MILSNYEIDRKWSLEQYKEALNAIRPLYEIKERNYKIANEELREVHFAHCEIVSRIAELSEDLHDGLGT